MGYDDGEEGIRILGPKEAVNYAFSVIKGRWPEAEEIISKDLQCAYFYALHIGRFLKEEEVKDMPKILIDMLYRVSQIYRIHHSVDQYNYLNLPKHQIII